MNKLQAIGLAAAWIAATGSTQGAVRSLSFGIDLNCPFGLEECWPQVFDRLIHLPGAQQMVENVSREDHETAIVRPAAGKLLPPDQVGRFIEEMRIGARLRGIEATIDGRVTVKNGQALLLATEFPFGLPLAPLKKKVHLDFRSKEPLPMNAEEREAHARLLREGSEQARWARLIGPLTHAGKGNQLRLQVREFYWYDPATPGARELSVGISVNSPYGLTEPWSAVRSCLVAQPGVTWVAAEPNEDGSTVALRLKPNAQPQPSAWNHALNSLGIGASLLGLEATVEGSITQERGRLKLRLKDGHTVALAPLTRNISWDYRKKREHLPTRVEREAYHQLRQANLKGTVRVSGPWLQESNGSVALLEVRQFQRAEGGTASGDFTAPDAPRTLRARFQPDGPLLLTWAPRRDPDLAGYQLYRAPKLTGPFERLNEKLLSTPRIILPDAKPLADHWYFVTAVDHAGNESPRSSPACGALPAPPQKVRVTVQANRAVLEWDENEEHDFESYTVYRSEKLEGPFGEIASVLYQNRYVNHGLRPGRTYFYVVTAVDTSDNESRHSDVAAAEVPALSARARAN